MECFALQVVSGLSRTKYSASTFAAFRCDVMGNTLRHLGYSAQSVAGLCQGSDEDLQCVSSPSVTSEQLDMLWRSGRSRAGWYDLLLVFVIRWEHEVGKTKG